ncbi:hypothetical protein VTK73DRAFT_2739 [Phialemonium thermophilum]|uniref:Uncharacterized protein n=1 Tax=Phialemonium thermophilum TaxID=223376 RepID=A0ABR3VPH3_9PEZI
MVKPEHGHGKFSSTTRDDCPVSLTILLSSRPESEPFRSYTTHQSMGRDRSHMPCCATAISEKGLGRAVGVWMVRTIQAGKLAILP